MQRPSRGSGCSPPSKASSPRSSVHTRSPPRRGWLPRSARRASCSSTCLAGETRTSSSSQRSWARRLRRNGRRRSGPRLATELTHRSGMWRAGMHRIDRCFHELRAARQKALIPYITAGDPDLAVTRELAWAFEGAGADILELGVPFSDPLADGSTIQRASQRALERGVTLKGVIGSVEQIRARSQMPIVLMSYMNPILRMGLDEFARRAKDAGVDGVIVPDLPPEEAGELRRCCAATSVSTIFLAAPTSTDARLRRIAEASEGYIHYVFLKGG